jgi:hypothetical protein
VKVRIKTPPHEREMDGLRLDGFEPGAVRDVSPSLGTWLVVKGYAEPEMRYGDAANRPSDAEGRPIERRKRPR